MTSPPPSSLGPYRIDGDGPAEPGHLHRAHDRLRDRTVALRIHPVDDLAPWRERVWAAVRASGSAHVVPIVSSGRLRDRLFIASEWSDGESLAGRIERIGPPGPAVALEVATAVAKVLDGLHARGAAHGRIRPEDVLHHGGRWSLTGFAAGPTAAERADDVRALGRLLRDCLEPGDTTRFDGALSGARPASVSELVAAVRPVLDARPGTAGRSGTTPWWQGNGTDPAATPTPAVWTPATPTPATPTPATSTSPAPTPAAPTPAAPTPAASMPAASTPTVPSVTPSEPDTPSVSDPAAPTPSAPTAASVWAPEARSSTWSATWRPDPPRHRPAPDPATHPATHPAETTITIGRDPGCDVTVDDDLLASRRHAELYRSNGQWWITDHSGRAGTFVNGRRVGSTPLRENDVIGVGHTSLRLESGRLTEVTSSGPISFSASGLVVTTAKGRRLLDDVGFALPANSLLAVVGPSGAGKSTLLRALTGSRPADAGTVHYEGRDLYRDYDELRSRIGVVPQDDILHTQLTVRAALRYAARLRFPTGVTTAERHARVEEVIHRLGLDDPTAAQRISTLSGGQRKRTSVALELLTRPSLLFLDEPTTGLDPGMRKGVMTTLRELADEGRTVITVTHDETSLEAADRLLVLARGGSLAYFGPPSKALHYFGASDFPDMFSMLDRDDVDWATRFRASPEARAYHRPVAEQSRGPATPPAAQASQAAAPASRAAAQASQSATPVWNGAGQTWQGAAPTWQGAASASHGAAPAWNGTASVRQGAAPVWPGAAARQAWSGRSGRSVPPVRPPAGQPGPRRQPALHQFGTLSLRYLAVIAADRQYAVFLALLPLVLAAVVRILPVDAGISVTALRDQGPAGGNPHLLLMVTLVGAAFAGFAGSFRELVKEREIYRREQAIGMSWAAYLASKIVVMGAITAVQAVAITVMGIAGRPGPDETLVFGSGLAEISVAVVVAALALMALGLLVSALIDNADRGMPVLVVVFLVQFVLCGTLFPLADKPGLEQLAWLVPVRWAFGMTAATAALPPTGTRPGETPINPSDPLWEHTVAVWAWDLTATVLLALLFLTVTGYALNRMQPRRRAW